MAPTVGDWFAKPFTQENPFAPHDVGTTAANKQADTAAAINASRGLIQPEGLDTYRQRYTMAQMAPVGDIQGLNNSYARSQYVNPQIAAGYNQIISGQTPRVQFAPIAQQADANAQAMAGRQGLSNYNPAAGAKYQGVTNAIYNQQENARQRQASQQALGDYAKYQLQGAQGETARQQALVDAALQEQAHREKFNANAAKYGFEMAVKMHEADVGAYQDRFRAMVKSDPGLAWMDLIRPGYSDQYAEQQLAGNSGYQTYVPRK